MFEAPEDFDYHVNHFMSDDEIQVMAETIVMIEETKTLEMLERKAGSIV